MTSDNPLRLSSHAKLNWYLRVLDRRPDGFHNIETVFETLALADTFEFRTLSDPVCRIEGFPPDVPSETNLMTRAWQLLRQRFPDRVGGVEILADKRLPRGGGLGGGSSNAAAALIAVDRLYGLETPGKDLLNWGAQLGSDVPFFLLGGCALGTGRGEVLSPLPAPEAFDVILVFPDKSVPTGDAYAKLSSMADREPVSTALQVAGAVETGDPCLLASFIHNDFELTLQDAPWFRATCEALESAGCLRAFLCGSGSTVAGICSNSADIERILRSVHESCPFPAYHTSAMALSMIRQAAV